VNVHVLAVHDCGFSKSSFVNEAYVSGRRADRGEGRRDERGESAQAVLSHYFFDN
jgi:hypothetical protein